MKKHVFVALMICSALTHAGAPEGVSDALAAAAEDAYAAMGDYRSTLIAAGRGNYGYQCEVVAQSHAGSFRTLIALFQSVEPHIESDPEGSSMRMRQVEQQARARLSMLKNMGCYE